MSHLERFYSDQKISKNVYAATKNVYAATKNVYATKKLIVPRLFDHWSDWLVKHD